MLQEPARQPGRILSLAGKTAWLWAGGLAASVAVAAPRLAAVNFLILIPFSLLYYYCVALGYAPALPFRLQRTVPLALALGLFALLLVEVVRGRSPRRRNWRMAGAIVCLVLVGAMTVLGVSHLPQRLDSAGMDIATFQVTAACNALIYFATGAFLLQSVAYRRLGLWVFASLTLFCLANFDPGSLSIRLPHNDSTYLFLGDAFALWGIFTLAVVGRRWRGVILAVGVVVLSTLVSRAAFAAFALTGVVWLVGGAPRRWWLATAVALTAVAMVLAVYHPGGSRLLRGYATLRIDDPKAWKPPFANDGAVEKIVVKGKTGLRFRRSVSALAFYEPGFSLTFPVGVSGKTLSWDMSLQESQKIAVHVYSGKGFYNLVYTDRKEFFRPGSRLNKDVTGKFLFLRLDQKQWSAFSRNLESDLRLFVPGAALLFVHGVSVYGNATLLDMSFDGAGPADGFLGSAQTFWSRNFSQLLPRLKPTLLQLPDLKEHWFLGAFAGQTRYFDGTMGNYIHNYLSLWRQYGIIPFLLFFAVYLGGYAAVGREFLRAARLKIDDPALLFTFLLATFNLVEIVFARSYATPYAWLSLGMMPAYLMSRTKGSVEGENHPGGGSPPELHEDRAHTEGVRQA